MIDRDSGAPALTLDDILDLRAYERVRERFRQRVMERKRLRRVALGQIMTLVFESIDTVRFQVQEMARAERILTDEGVQAELDVYNRLLPQRGELSGTLFIELTTEEELRRWLPALVGIERSLAIDLSGAAGGAGPLRVASVPEASHAEALTREEVTPAVHYLRFPFSPEAVAAFDGSGQVAVVVEHPQYQARAILSDATRRELAGDLAGRADPVSYD